MKPHWLLMGAKGLHRRERRFPFLLLAFCEHNSSDCGSHVRFELVGDFQCSGFASLPRHNINRYYGRCEA
jgi:hypothetical protein